MLGQRILQSYPDLEDYDAPSEPAVFPTGLTVRRTKSAGLRIVTESEVLRSDNSKGPVNANYLSASRQSFLPIRTPDTSHTFGVPNPTMPHSPKFFSPRASTPASSVASPAVLAARRMSRYSQAENALRTAAEGSSAETSPQELQVRALEKATAMLSEQASEARETADRLRTALAKRDENSLSPDEVKALQREVWREQRRSAVRQDMSIHTQSLLTKICSPIAETPPPLAQPAPPITRAEANLQKFLQQSPTHRIFPPNRSPTQSAPLVRRKTISQVQPMQLRSTALELALRSPVDMHSRSLSLDSPDPRRSSASTDVTCVSEVASERTTVVPQLQLTIRRNLTVKGPPSPSPLSPGPGGIVSIEAQAPPRPRESLIAEVGQVPLPDYAVDLLEDLVASSLDVALSPLSPSPLVVRAPTYPYNEAQPRASSSLPDFLRFRATQTQEDQNMPSARPSPPSRPPSLILDRLLNKPDIPSMSPSPPFSFSNASSSSWSPVPSPTPGNALSPPPAARRRPGASEAQQKRRSSAGSTQSLYVPSTSRFSSLRLSTPSLFAVPETDALGGSGAGPSDPLSRPQSSMSSYAPLDSPEAVLERRYGSAYQMYYLI